MSDSQNSSLEPGEIPEEVECKSEVVTDEEDQEPAQKRMRTPESSPIPQPIQNPVPQPTSLPSSGSALGILETMIMENRQLREETAGFRIEVKNLHNAVLEISNSAIEDREKLEERILKIEKENLELKEVNRENSKFTAKHILDHKLSTDNEIRQLQEKYSNLEYGFEQYMTQNTHKIQELEAKIFVMKNMHAETVQKQEQSMIELKEQLGRFQNAELNILKILETKVAGLENKAASTSTQHPDPQLEQRLTAMELALRSKIKAYCKVLQECRECMAEMKKASGKVAEENPYDYQEEEVSLDHKPHIQEIRSFVRSDDCVITPTRAELDYEGKCIFCKSASHISMECRNVPEYISRIHVLQKQNRCTKCLDLCDPDEHHYCPRDRIMCSNCEWDTEKARRDKDFHHPIVCRLNDQSLYCKGRREDENKRRVRHGLPPRFVI